MRACQQDSHCDGGVAGPPGAHAAISHLGRCSWGSPRVRVASGEGRSWEGAEGPVGELLQPRGNYTDDNTHRNRGAGTARTHVGAHRGLERVGAGEHPRTARPLTPIHVPSAPGAGGELEPRLTLARPCLCGRSPKPHHSGPARWPRVPDGEAEAQELGCHLVTARRWQSQDLNRVPAQRWPL